MTNDIERVSQLTSKIEDGISDAVCELLYIMARDVPEGQAIVEIGRGKGKSTVWLAKGTEAGQRNKVYSFGPHLGSQAHGNTDRQNTCVRFTANLATQDTVVYLNGASDDAARKWKEKIGLLWVNVSQEYEDVKWVLLSWQCHLLPNARVAIHGGNQPGPAQVVKEYLGNLGNFTFERSVESVVVITIDKCIHYWIINSNEMGICKYCGRERNFKRLGREATQTGTGRRQGRKGK